MSAEFNLIQRFFTRATPNADLGVGDDAALVRVSAGHQLAISTDMSVADTHFFASAPPHAIGWKSMAVNVSDMAAMGARPRWATLGLSLPHVNEVWLAEFSEGLFACASEFGVELIGGDTTRGPLNISITIMGEVPSGQALQRNGAKVGDDVWLGGQLGAAALALYEIKQHQQQTGVLDSATLMRSIWANALHYPQPQLALGLALRGIAHSAIDVSDGVLADLGHILKASQVGARLYWADMPKPTMVDDKFSLAVLQQCVLAGGDDYVLCWTAPVQHRLAIARLATSLGLSLYRVGEVTARLGVEVVDAQGKIQEMANAGFEHFET